MAYITIQTAPEGGKLSTGPTSASYSGFTAPVSVTVSKNGRRLLSYEWARCIGLGGPRRATPHPNGATSLRPPSRASRRALKEPDVAR